MAHPDACPPPSGAHPRAPDWAIERLGVRSLWDRGLRGQGMVIGHLDTGIDPAHPLLHGRLAGFRSFDRGGHPDERVAPHDSGAHGTRTASLLCGGTDGGVPIGVAPEARLLSAQVIEGGDALARILAGLDWLASKQVRVGCLALGLEPDEPIFPLVLRRLLRHRMLVVAPIGNGGAGRSLSPASEPGVLSTGAFDEAGRIAPFSGSRMSGFACTAPALAAPGVHIPAAGPGPGAVVTCSGTSYAAAYLAGIATLLLQAYPSIEPADLRKALVTTAQPTVEGQSHRCAGGCVRPLAALESLGKPAPPTADSASPAGEPGPTAYDPQLVGLLEGRSEEARLRAVLSFHEDRTRAPGDFHDHAERFINQVNRATHQTPVRRTSLPWLGQLLVDAPCRWLRQALRQPDLVRADYTGDRPTRHRL